VFGLGFQLDGFSLKNCWVINGEYRFYSWIVIFLIDWKEIILHLQTKLV